MLKRLRRSGRHPYIKMRRSCSRLKCSSRKRSILTDGEIAIRRTSPCLKYEANGLLWFVLFHPESDVPVRGTFRYTTLVTVHSHNLTVEIRKLIWCVMFMGKTNHTMNRTKQPKMFHTLCTDVWGRSWNRTYWRQKHAIYRGTASQPIQRTCSSEERAIKIDSKRLPVMVGSRRRTWCLTTYKIIDVAGACQRLVRENR